MVSVKKELEMDKRYSAVESLSRIYHSSTYDYVWLLVSKPATLAVKSNTLFMNFVCSLMGKE